MAGFVNFKYRDGIIPLHTKSSFNSTKVLTVQNVLPKILLFSYTLHKLIRFPHLLPNSVRNTVPNNGPNYSSTYENNMAWLGTYENYYMSIS